MQTITKSAKTTQDKASESPESIASAAQLKAQEVAKMEQDVAAEVAAIENAEKAFEVAVKATGSNGMIALAKAVGASITDAGRPGFAPWLRFTTALAIRKEPYTKHDQLLGVIRKEATATLEKAGGKTDEHIGKIVGKLVSATSKAGHGGSASCKLKLASPVQWAIALG